jgi:ADP-heptose:LPS heptosyltransferase
VLADLALETVAGILALADGYVGNDSGVTQLAAAVRGAEGRATPTVALFGPTDTRVWAPRGRHVRLIRSADGTMESIEAETVWAAVSAAIGEIAPREKSKPRD